MATIHFESQWAQNMIADLMQCVLRVGLTLHEGRDAVYVARASDNVPLYLYQPPFELVLLDAQALQQQLSDQFARGQLVTVTN